MPATFDPKRSKKTYDRQPSPSIIDNDRYTPTPRDSFNDRKSDIYPKDTKTPRKPIQNDPYSKPTSPQIQSIELHPPRRPELYFIESTRQDNHVFDRPVPSATHSTNNRVTPLPIANHFSEKPEMYHLAASNDTPRKVSAVIDHHYPTKHDDEPVHTKINDTKLTSDFHPGKITLYHITTNNQENRQPTPVLHSQRASSPPIRVNRRTEPVAYDIKDDDDADKVIRTTRRRDNPPVLQTAPRNIQYIPTTQSKASESITRSMRLYRHGYQ